MSRVLLLAYHFPPLGGPGTQRSAKFARDLPRLGHTPIVVTGPGVSTGRWDPLDATLMDMLGDGVEVVRVKGPVPGGGGRADRWLDRRGAFSQWWIDGAVRAAEAVVRDVDVILASMAPYETGIAAAELAQRSGKPWIADLRDPWALDEMRVYPSAVHHRRDLQRMIEALRTAHAIVMNTADARDALVATFPELGLKHVTAIPNGFDAADFPIHPPSRQDDALRIVHTGSLHFDLGVRHRRSRGTRRVLGGARDVDILPRSHVYLLQAMTALREQGWVRAGEIELHLAGVLSDAEMELCRRDDVVVHGYVDHLTSVELLRSADLLFLPMHDLPAGQRSRIVPGKTYEYLASGRPLLAAVPDGDARALVEGAPNGLVCRPTDARAMARHLADEVAHLRAHGRRPDAWHPRLSAYERHALAADLADVIERITGRPGTRDRHAGPPLRVA